MSQLAPSIRFIPIRSPNGSVGCSKGAQVFEKGASGPDAAQDAAVANSMNRSDA